MFTTWDIMKRKELGLDRSQLKVLLEKELIEPTVRAKGRGTKNLFDLDALYRLELYLRLRDWGLQRGPASRVSKDVDFSKVGDTPWYLVKPLDRVEKVGELAFTVGLESTGGSIPSQIPAGYDSMVVIDLAAVKAKIKELFGAE
jgi:hypothetical protein